MKIILLCVLLSISQRSSLSFMIVKSSQLDKFRSLGTNYYKSIDRTNNNNNVSRESDTQCNVVSYDHEEESRRNFMMKSAITFATTLSMNGENAIAAGDDDDDLTTKMFNDDGSLKDEGTAQVAKSKTISIPFPSGQIESAIVSVDGSFPSLPNDSSDTATATTISVSYALPDKWTAAPEYIDTSEGLNVKACDFVSIYQVPGVSAYKTLDKAAMTGVAKAVGIKTLPQTDVGYGPFSKELLSADIISGKKVMKPVTSSSDEIESRAYYEFDIAVAPKTCDSSAENLGLGFCPYDEIALISSTIVNGRMYVIGVKCRKDEWKQANADLKRVRESFFVDSAV